MFQLNAPLIPFQGTQSMITSVHGRSCKSLSQEAFCPMVSGRNLQCSYCVSPLHPATEHQWCSCSGHIIFPIDFTHLDLDTSSAKECSWGPKDENNTPNVIDTVVTIAQLLKVRQMVKCSVETMSKWEAKIWRGEEVLETLEDVGKNISLLCTVLQQVLAAGIIFIIWSPERWRLFVRRNSSSKASVTAVMAGGAGVGENQDCSL